ncbi:ABC transporter substrate-binding protein [Paenibacillus oceani]|uniref:Extracellular solute-binding protein n=1 Tax=Paenibacillus oceani TaxID=2772510 RepID=A0A927C7Q3_9BACL|nr:extracellular solute-binding protein [Paenibacillus oceani]MBD2861056.1 extracellular solute-binding protein [Paenibacillus oceani]
MNYGKLGLLLTVVTGLLTGCGGNNAGSGNTEPAGNEPVTIKIGASGSANYANEALFQETVVEPVKKKYPHITLEYIPMGGKSSVKSIDDWMASGNIPDLILHSNGSMGELFDYDLLTDMTPLVKQTGTNLNRFDKAVLDSVRVASDQGWLVGIPYSQNFNALYYNKDIFDKFAVSYPTDGMTWDSVIELSKRVARTEAGISYVGLHPQWVLRPAYPLALTIVDAKTGRSQVTNAQWKQVSELLQKIVAIPNNWDGKSGSGDFWGKKTIAMLASTNVFALLEPESQKGFSGWDVVQYPSFPDQPDVSGMVDAWVLIVAKTSKHKTEAMQVINVITSDEVQLLAASKYAQMSTLANPVMKQQFGSKMDSLNIKGKNLQGIFKGKIVAAPKFSPYEKQARAPYQANMLKVFSGEMDVNTALRDADQKINKLLDEYKNR